MSALGQKRTCAAQELMSALPPKADMCGARGMSALGQERTFASIRSPRRRVGKLTRNTMVIRQFALLVWTVRLGAGQLFLRTQKNQSSKSLRVLLTSFMSIPNVELSRSISQ